MYIYKIMLVVYVGNLSSISTDQSSRLMSQQNFSVLEKKKQYRAYRYMVKSTYDTYDLN